MDARSAASARGARRWLPLAFLLLAAVVYAPALDGEFVSDDGHYVANNFYIRDLSAENLVAILSPTSPVPLVVENYAPVHLLLHAAEWQVFGASVRGYHVVNVLVHGLATGLLVVLFRRSGIGERAAWLGGALFLVHPANVEAVAWISQLKTTSAMVLTLAALLVQPRRPIPGTGLFALALLAKATAAVGLFAGAVFAWTRTGPFAPRADARQPGASLVWLVPWAVAFGLFAVAEFSAFGRTAGRYPEVYPDPFVRALSTLAIGLRYLVMAATSYGTSTFHEPAAITSLLDPWLLGALVVLGAIGARFVVVLRARRVEAAFWTWALVSWAPIAGVIPLPYPMADRYLYFILPGLIGAGLLAAPDAIARLSRAWPAIGRERLEQALVAVAVVAIAVFALRAHERARVWRSADTVNADSARHYPTGRSALLAGAIAADARGDAEEAVALLRRAEARGYVRLRDLLPPNYPRIQDDPAFVALKRSWANTWVERHAATERPGQPELMMLAQAYITLGDFDAARRTLHRAIYAGGPMTDYLRGALDQLDALERATGPVP